MDPITFKSVVHAYAEGVAKGSFDTDITSARERKFVVLFLNTAANDGLASLAYSRLTPEFRTDIIRRLIDGQWTANVAFFVEYASPAARSLYHSAFERAITILRGI